MTVDSKSAEADMGVKMRKYLICIDSDGCAIDSMEVKHRKCFGPCLVEVWNLGEWRKEILDYWNEMNLYSMSRGINRFLGLEKMLTETDQKFRRIDGIDEYREWCRKTDRFSNVAVEKLLRGTHHGIFEKVLTWSEQVNGRISGIAENIRPFDGVKEAFAQMKEEADIAIVSSANPNAIQEEWNRFGLMDMVDYVMAQDAGTKSWCIRQLIEEGYAPECILMVGDAPGDENAARENYVRFYPILAGQECESWKQLSDEDLPRFFGGRYDTEYQRDRVKEFYKNLGGACYGEK